MDFNASMAIAASGLKAQSDRMKTIAENIANANSASTNANGDPYRRKIATVTSSFDREMNATLVKSAQPVADMSEFRQVYDPGNPGADKQGYVKMPNVNSLIEIMDMREAQSSYEADLSVMEASKSMLARTVDLLKK